MHRKAKSKMSYMMFQVSEPPEENKETNFNSELVEEPVDLTGKRAMFGEIIENKRDGPEDESDKSNKRKQCVSNY